jgi:hemerythrin superfamily protein
MAEHAGDVIDFLVSQHREIESLLDATAASGGDERAQRFFELRRLLAVHETAEEEFVHPRTRRAVDAGDTIVTRRLHEETEAKELLVRMEGMDAAAPEFDAALAELRTGVLAHARAEEKEEFPALRGELDDEHLLRMRKLVEIAEKTAPTRPHPGVSLAGENFFAGPFAAMLDRARDLLTRP